MRYSPAEIEAMLAEKPVAPAQVPTGATCGECRTFAVGWNGSDWKCRRADLNVNADSHACHKWHPRPPDFEPSAEAMRATAAAMDRMFDGIAPLVIDTTPVKRHRPAGLRGHDGGVVYFVDCGALTKIGHTNGWIEHRLKGIATHNPFDLTLWGLVPGDGRFEREWHAELAGFRYRNEWFRLTDEIRVRIKELILEHGGELYE